MTTGSLQAQRSLPQDTAYMPSGDMGFNGGGTIVSNTTKDFINNYLNLYGPSGRDTKEDTQKDKRHGRWHKPDIPPVGPNPWLTDRIDGLITDATNSPFTTIILPYKYVDYPDGKLKWNVWSFDEGMASRVPYEAAARTLTQSKRSFSAYTVRHGLAITLEHNFAASPQGVENFKNQLKQLVGSIQYTNDLDVHIALITAPSYEKTMKEKYYSTTKTPQQVCREYVELYGFLQKNPNALDILIEEAKYRLKSWGGPMPNFMLANIKLGFQLQMTPEKTNYYTQGPDGLKRLREGPNINSYRGLSVINTRSFSMETGQPPRDVLRRRVRVAEYYRIPASPENKKRDFEFYNEARDNWFTLSFMDLMSMALLPLDLEDGDGFGDADILATSFKTPSFGLKKIQNFSGLSPEQRKVIQTDFITLYTSMQSALDSGRPIPLKWFTGFYTMHYDNVVASLAPHHHTSSIDGKANVCVLARNFTKTDNGKQIGIFQDVDLASNQEQLLLQRVYQDRCGILTEKHTFDFSNRVITQKRSTATHSDAVLKPVFVSFEPNVTVNHSTDPYANIVISGYVINTVYHNHIDPFLFSKWLLEICKKIKYTNGESIFQYSVKLDKELRDKLKTENMEPKDDKDPFFCFVHKSAQNRCVLSTYKQTLEHWKGIDLNYVLDDEDVKTTLAGTTTATTVFEARNFLFGSVVASLMTRLFAFHDFTNDFNKLNQVALQPNTLQLGDYNVVNDDLNISWSIRHLGRKDGEDPTKKAYLSFIEKIRNENSLVYAPGIGYTDHRKVYKVSKRKGVARRGGDGGGGGGGDGGGGGGGGGDDDDDNIDLTEIVVIRPNIEHYMLGVILGMSGDSLGNTLWGQTELSVYDDSMHGVWGMSYKYHERAIVFNEKNLIRLWDVAYDGYNGGKEDTHVNWMEPESVSKFQTDTMEVTQNYSGASMMVLMFHHNNNYENHPNYKRNWPSPIVFDDDCKQPRPVRLGFDNLDEIDVSQYRVFNNPLYREQFLDYKRYFPNFCELHQTRKVAGQAAQENETVTDSLAFEGTMRVKEKGQLIYEVQGSGHHGPDFVGAASIRSGKGYKNAPGQPQLRHMI